MVSTGTTKMGTASDRSAHQEKFWPLILILDNSNSMTRPLDSPPIKYLNDLPPLLKQWQKQNSNKGPVNHVKVLVISFARLANVQIGASGPVAISELPDHLELKGAIGTNYVAAFRQLHAVLTDLWDSEQVQYHDPIVLFLTDGAPTPFDQLTPRDRDWSWCDALGRGWLERIDSLALESGKTYHLQTCRLSGSDEAPPEFNSLCRGSGSVDWLRGASAYSDLENTITKFLNGVVKTVSRGLDGISQHQKPASSATRYRPKFVATRFLSKVQDSAVQMYLWNRLDR